MIISIYAETKWSYPIFKKTPPHWLAQFSVAIDEYRKHEARLLKKARKEAKRTARNKPEIR